MIANHVELIRGKYSILRLTEEYDAELIVNWRNQPDIARWLNQRKPLTVEEHLLWFRKAKERGDLFIFFESSDGTPVGCTSIFNFDHLGTSAEWGRLFTAGLGKGSFRMLEACYLLHRMCFECLGFFRLHGQVWADNERAWRLYQFLGWVQEGVRRKHFLSPIGYHDVRVIGVFPSEFLNQRKAIEEKIYQNDLPPTITDFEIERMRGVVSKIIHRSLD